MNFCFEKPTVNTTLTTRVKQWPRGTSAQWVAATLIALWWDQLYVVGYFHPCVFIHTYIWICTPVYQMILPQQIDHQYTNKLEVKQSFIPTNESINQWFRQTNFQETGHPIIISNDQSIGVSIHQLGNQPSYQSSNQSTSEYNLCMIWWPDIGTAPSEQTSVSSSPIPRPDFSTWSDGINSACVTDFISTVTFSNSVTWQISRGIRLVSTFSCVQYMLFYQIGKQMNIKAKFNYSNSASTL